MPTLPTTYRPQSAKLKSKPHRPRPLPTSSSTWRKIRAQQLNEQPLCEPCLKRGITTPATQVDHIDGNNENNEKENYQSICEPCHRSKSAREYGFKKKESAGTDG